MDDQLMCSYLGLTLEEWKVLKEFGIQHTGMIWHNKLLKEIASLQRKCAFYESRVRDMETMRKGELE